MEYKHTPSTAYSEYSILRVQHTLSTAYSEYSILQVQHTPSTAYSEYSILRVQHTPSTAYTQYSLHPVQHTQDCSHQQKTFPSGRNGSVRDVRDTPVADYSAPGVNTTRRVAHCPPIAVSPFLLALSVSYFKQTLWRCGQL